MQIFPEPKFFRDSGSGKYLSIQKLFPSFPLCTVLIHAPVKGRLTICQNLTRTKSFNPRTREGATCLCRAVSRKRHNRRTNRFNPRPREGATAPLSGPMNRAFQRHFARTSFFSSENKGGFPNIFYFTCIFNRLAMRASHGGKPVHLRCPHRQTG